MADTQQISMDLPEPAPQWLEDLLIREDEEVQPIRMSPFVRRALNGELPVNEVYGRSF